MPEKSSHRSSNSSSQRPSRPSSNCEDCAYFDYNDESDTYECMHELDEDELIRFMKGDSASCPYYKYYDEYKFVRKQN